MPPNELNQLRYVLGERDKMGRMKLSGVLHEIPQFYLRLLSRPNKKDERCVTIETH